MDVDTIITRLEGVQQNGNDYIFPSIRHAAKAEQMLDSEGCETVRMGDVVTIKRRPNVES